MRGPRGGQRYNRLRMNEHNQLLQALLSADRQQARCLMVCRVYARPFTSLCKASGKLQSCSTESRLNSLSKSIDRLQICRTGIGCKAFDNPAGSCKVAKLEASSPAAPPQTPSSLIKAKSRHDQQIQRRVCVKHCNNTTVSAMGLGSLQDAKVTTAALSISILHTASQHSAHSISILRISILCTLASQPGLCVSRCMLEIASQSTDELSETRMGMNQMSRTKSRHG